MRDRENRRVLSRYMVHQTLVAEKDMGDSTENGQFWTKIGEFSFHFEIQNQTTCYDSLHITLYENYHGHIV